MGLWILNLMDIRCPPQTLQIFSKCFMNSESLWLRREDVDVETKNIYFIPLFFYFSFFFYFFFWSFFFPLEDVIILLKHAFFLYFNLIYFSYC
jgi:hypothetical protein